MKIELAQTGELGSWQYALLDNVGAIIAKSVHGYLAKSHCNAAACKAIEALVRADSSQITDLTIGA
jgi:hypothetical protein